MLGASGHYLHNVQANDLKIHGLENVFLILILFGFDVNVSHTTLNCVLEEL